MINCINKQLESLRCLVEISNSAEIPNKNEILNHLTSIENLLGENINSYGTTSEFLGSTNDSYNSSYGAFNYSDERDFLNLHSELDLVSLDGGKYSLRGVNYLTNGTLDIPEEVIIIDMDFYNYPAIEYVHIRGSVIGFPESGFNHSNIRGVKFYKNVTVPSNTFKDCKYLENIAFPPGFLLNQPTVFNDIKHNCTLRCNSYKDSILENITRNLPANLRLVYEII